MSAPPSRPSLAGEIVHNHAKKVPCGPGCPGYVRCGQRATEKNRKNP